MELLFGRLMLNSEWIVIGLSKSKVLHGETLNGLLFMSERLRVGLACVHQDGLLVVHLADHEKFGPPMHFQGRKPCCLCLVVS